VHPHLATGILLDANVIRALLVPALISLFGSWNWWPPHPLARLLRVPDRNWRSQQQHHL
jgi:putative drug exporter of the RND superfamily